MKKNDQDILARAYAMLQSLRQNVDKLTLVEEIYVNEYHASLDILEGIGIDVAQFRISPSEVQHRITASWLGGQAHSKEKYILKALLLTKLDEVLIYFDITYSEKPRKIGFSLPDKS